MLLLLRLFLTVQPGLLCSCSTQHTELLQVVSDKEEKKTAKKTFSNPTLVPPAAASLQQNMSLYTQTCLRKTQGLTQTMHTQTCKLQLAQSPRAELCQ